MKKAADALVAKGLAAAGYTILSIDDCWMDKQRNATGFLQANANFSATGGGDMRALGDYIHAKGLKYGLYESSGTHSCQGFMGSLGYEWIDAQTFADWGADFLKYDDCYHEQFALVEKDAPRRFPFDAPPVLRYPLMGLALNRTKRPISYMCNFPWQLWKANGDAAMGGDWTGEFCNSWRTCGDPTPGFGSAMAYVDCAEQWADVAASGPGRWNNLAAVEIGNGAPGAGAMTPAQERAVLSLYALVRTPLMIGADVTTLDGDSLQVYLNTELIDTVVRDPLGKPGRKVRGAGDPSGLGELWAGPLEGGAYFAVLVNRAGGGGGGANATVTVRFAEDLGAAFTKAAVRDVWQHAAVPGSPLTGAFSASVAPGSAVAVTITPVAW